MAHYTPASLESLLKNLTLTDDEADHEEILRHCDGLLSTSKAHPRALHTKIVALLSLDRYDDAIKVIESADGQAVAETATLERAYCLYKLGRLQEAEEAARKAADGGDRNKRGLRHVEAQAAYRSERFVHAAKIYKELADGMTQVDNEDYDLSVNTTAADAQIIWAGQGHLVKSTKPNRGALDAFETAFNSACISLARGEYGQALVLLKRSKDLCNALEDLSDEEKKLELTPIIAQEVCALINLGRIEDAMARSQELGVSTLTDTALKLIATYNEIAATSRLPDYNPHKSIIAAETATASAKTTTARPFLFQARAIERNDAVIDFQVGKHSSVKAKAAKITQTYPNDPANGVISAAAHAGNVKGKTAENKVEALWTANPKDIGLALTLVQLRIRSKNITGAIQTMDKLLSALGPEQRYQPGLVGLLVALYQSQARKKDVKDLLSQASDFWKNTDTPNPTILQASGKAQLDSDDSADLRAAGELFTSLLSADPTNKFATAGLVASYATIDPSQITPAHISKLTPVQTLISDIDAAALESLGVAQQSRKRSAEEDAGPKVKPKKVKKKKTRLPKDVEPGKAADPERWLPERDRSTYRPKGRKDKKKAAGATQGGPTAAGESSEVLGGELLKKAGGGPGGGANKKKKKKGGKW
ncbi:uncharacterized protein H6S33_002340 [Morchella sextelata]|uniref:uncharacterized protein n=1 Tax=Morchella sextelata TaxID=1174677 RepID=UPI001D041FFD|nr:uncharacterized protein H6S33_002340 [Morchella sextelata]KAH0608288.1 hypothetical protein H6S33_002340 [Morchella sextelata]